MTTLVTPRPLADSSPPRAPTHLELPESDGTIVENFQEHPQAILLTSSILPLLKERHPDDHFAIGQNSGIYFRYTDPPLLGCKAPDWFYVPNVPPMPAGTYRRSYVLWQETIPPLMIIEFSSGDGSEERDRTPWTGKFWVYERSIRPAFYAIFVVSTGQLEAHRLVEDRFEAMQPNDRGHFRINALGIELGVWQGTYCAATMSWLRFYDSDGRLLPTAEERAEQERQRAEQECQRAEQERQRAEVLAAKLRELGVDPGAV